MGVSLAAQDGPVRKPQFHDPNNTVVFPQFVVGRFGDIIIEATLRIAVPTSSGAAAIPSSFGGAFNVAVEPRTPGHTGPCLGAVQTGLNPILLLDHMRLNFRAPPGEIPCEGALIFEPGETVSGDSGESPSGFGSALDGLVFSFFYTLRDLEGKLLDTVAVPPSRASQSARYVMGRDTNFDIGVAIFVSNPGSIIRARITPSADSGDGPVGAPTVFETDFNIRAPDGSPAFSSAFFPSALFFLQGFPVNIPAAEVQLTLMSPGEMYVVGLGVHSEFPIVQLSGLPVETVPPQN